MKQRFALVLISASICASAYPQQPTPLAQGWTDKNNTERAAAYMIQVAYNERGYWGVKVETAAAGSRRIFTVDPGPLYHIKKLTISGLSARSLETLDPGAPKAGEVYSPARMNDWVATLQKKYHQRVNWGVRGDPPNAQVSIDVNFSGNAIVKDN